MPGTYRCKIECQGLWNEDKDPSKDFNHNWRIIKVGTDQPVRRLATPAPSPNGTKPQTQSGEIRRAVAFKGAVKIACVRFSKMDTPLNELTISGYVLELTDAFDAILLGTEAPTSDRERVSAPASTQDPNADSSEPEPDEKDMPEAERDAGFLDELARDYADEGPW